MRKLVASDIHDTLLRRRRPGGGIEQKCARVTDYQTPALQSTCEGKLANKLPQNNANLGPRSPREKFTQLNG